MTTTARVLLVEDDKYFRRASEASLRQRGCDVVIAIDGADGLRLARTEPRADVILLDLLLPKLPGLDLLRALKRDPATSDLPVLILSNSSRAEDKQQVLELGAAGYYIKANLSLKELAARVEQLVAHAPPASCPSATASVGNGSDDEANGAPQRSLEAIGIIVGTES